jgi:F420-0:gamma-glutamyl ligase-like protein
MKKYGDRSVKNIEESVEVDNVTKDGNTMVVSEKNVST